MTIAGGVDAENRDVYMQDNRGYIYQKWDLVYAKNWKGEPKKGQLNPQFGLYVDRTFHIVSGLPRGRYLDVLGRNLVIKTQNGRRTQKWYFHQPSRSIRSRNNNQSWDIVSSGRGRNMQIYSTRGAWW